YVPPPGQSVHGHYSYAVHGEYFSALGIDLRKGRFLTSADSHRAERVCVVDEDSARRYWPNGGALGQRIALGDKKDDAQLFTVVGVVGAVKQAALTEAQGQGAVYLPYAYRDNESIFIVTRTSQRPEAFAETLRKLVRAAHPALALDNIRSMDTRIADSLIARRSPALLAGIFAGVALLLAAIGTYGVLSYAVAQRTRNIAGRLSHPGASREQRRSDDCAANGITGITYERSSLRFPAINQIARIYSPGGAYARSWHRLEHRDLQFDQRSVLARIAVQGT